MALADNMMILRKKKGHSQAELRKMTGTSGDVIGRYERGDISHCLCQSPDRQNKNGARQEHDV